MDILKLKKMGVKNIKLFGKGKRGLIYIGVYKNKRVSIKVKKPESKARDRILNEARFLKILNKHKIGPKLLFHNKDYLVYGFVKGKFILDYFKEADKRKIKKIIFDVLDQCFVMDKLKINKLEMHHPLKHIIINKKPVLIDFERSYYTKKPKNLTQFYQFLISYKSSLKGLEINPDLIKILKKYKEKPLRSKFLNIKKQILK